MMLAPGVTVETPRGEGTVVRKLRQERVAWANVRAARSWPSFYMVELGDGQQVVFRADELKANGVKA